MSYNEQLQDLYRRYEKDRHMQPLKCTSWLPGPTTTAYASLSD